MTVEISITNRSRNPLLNREELAFEIKSRKTPSRGDIKKKIAAMCNAQEELVIVGKLVQNFGSHSISGSANFYDKKEYMQKAENEYRVNKNLGIKKKKGAASGASPEATQPEKPKKKKEKANSAG